MVSESRSENDSLLQAVSEPARASLRRLLAASPVSPVELEYRLSAYGAMLRTHVAHVDVLDLWTADLIERKCLAMIGKLEGADERTCRLVQSAVLYFVKQDDAEDDIRSPAGFDDDLEVVEAVARELEFDDVLAMQGA